MIYLPELPVVGRWFYPLLYEESIRTHARANGLDPLFVAAVIRQESGFRPTIHSAVGAVGLMQLMPATARWAAGRAGLGQFQVAQLEDPAVNIQVGCWYLSYLVKRFKSLDKVLAAYNGGEGNLNYWGTLEGEQLAYAYPETQSYVAQCLRAYDRYKSLYGEDMREAEARERGMRPAIGPPVLPPAASGAPTTPHPAPASPAPAGPH